MSERNAAGAFGVLFVRRARPPAGPSAHGGDSGLETHGVTGPPGLGRSVTPSRDDVRLARLASESHWLQTHLDAGLASGLRPAPRDCLPSLAGMGDWTGTSLGREDAPLRGGPVATAVTPVSLRGLE